MYDHVIGSFTHGDSSMTKEQLESYYGLLERFVSLTNDPSILDRDSIVRVLSELCGIFRIAKGVTEIYLSPAHEKSGEGEILCDCDNGHGDVMAMRVRIVAPSMVVLIHTLYQSSESEPLDDEEKARLDVVIRALLGFISRNRLVAVVERLGFYDDSGFPNMRSFTRRIQQMGLAGELGEHTAVCFNLYHFSVINRDIGRENGDVVMKNYTEMIRKAMGDNGMLCRMGGDNFVGIFESQNTDAVVALLRGLPVPYDKYKSKRVMVSCSAGVFKIPFGFEFTRPSQVIDSIFTAARVARMLSDERVVFYDDTLMQMKDKDMWVRRLFPGALDNEEFKAFYQPKVDVETGRIVGAEALCRWIQHDKIIPPMEFIPVLEQNTDICILDFHMLGVVCRDIRRWMDEGKSVVRVSVNLSRKHLVDVDLIRHILDIIDRYNVPHEFIEIELTETTTDVEFRDLRRIVDGLQKAGICVSVDDFGMGYSSLNLIRELPWNVLKIDKCFVPLDDENDDGVTSKMFKHVVRMAQDIGLECIAEGIETGKQLEFLEKNHCDIAQGFYFDKPLPVNDFEDRLAMGCYDLKKLSQN